MGRASNRKKQRRGGVKARAERRHGFGIPLAMGFIAIIGSALVVVSADRDASSSPPLVGDHWHAAYAIYDCDQPVPSLSDNMAASQSGIHTHSDSLVHLEVASTKFTGTNATVGAFADDAGLELSDDRIEGPGISRRAGDRCGDDSGQVQLAVWDDPDDGTPTVLTEGVADYAIKDRQLLTIAFVPPGTDIPKPSTEAIAELGGQQQPPPAPPPPTSTTTAPTTTTTSAPPGEQPVGRWE